MGFFGALGRIMAGKPVYTPEEVAKQNGDSPPPQSVVPASDTAGAQVAPTGPKTIPNLRLGRVECRPNGQRMDVYVDIRNESNDEVFVDKISLLGGRRELDSQLRPGEVKQFLVYSGSPLTNAPSGYAELQYRKSSDGDYFMNYHDIRCRQESNGVYVVTEFRQQGPVKDIQ